ncbi:MAG: hypothetical protein AAFO73_03840 [Pseudomonadota bacterium]
MISETPPPPPPAHPAGITAAPGATVVHVNNVVERGPTINLGLGEGEQKSRGLAALLSFVFVGAGQIYNGQIGKGIGMFFLCVFLWFLLLGWIINIWAIFDAYNTAKRKNDLYMRAMAGGASP